jgi:hypothetical protein
LYYWGWVWLVCWLRENEKDKSSLSIFMAT